MAFFAGTGPFGKTCGDCKLRGYYRESSRTKWSEELQQHVARTYRVSKCEAHRRMNGGRHGADVEGDYEACKYFEDKPRKE